MPEEFGEDEYDAAVVSIRDAPAMLRSAVKDLSDEQLDTPYRPDGWTVRQVVHHLPDSHLNAYVRVKWALTEQMPTIKTYDEVEWAELEDSLKGPIDNSLQLLAALHARWVSLLSSLDAIERARTITHPEWGTVNVDYLVAQYAWHGKHHIAQITSLRRRKGWNDV